MGSKRQNSMESKAMKFGRGPVNVTNINPNTVPSVSVISSTSKGGTQTHPVRTRGTWGKSTAEMFA